MNREIDSNEVIWRDYGGKEWGEEVTNYRNVACENAKGECQSWSGQLQEEKRGRSETVNKNKLEVGGK